MKKQRLGLLALATRFGVCAALVLGGFSSQAIVTDEDDLENVELVNEALGEEELEHCDDLVNAPQPKDFEAIFTCGDELFERRFNAVDGVGGNVGDGGRFSRVPRADLNGADQWANHVPMRATGPNAAACNGCHLGVEIGGGGDGPGPAAVNVIRDPLHAGSPGMFIQRNTPHLFGMGGAQLVAEEMSEELAAIVQQTIAEADADDNGHSRTFCFFFPSLCLGEATNDLIAKGVDFGSVTVKEKIGPDQIIINAEGVDDDLIIKPFQWKGVELSVRTFQRGAFHNELGMNPEELAGTGVDGDFDNVVDEITIEDSTAMTAYLAGQPRPVTEVELDQLRQYLEGLGTPEADELLADLGLPTLDAAALASIANGESVFSAIGCADCHVESFDVDDPIFSEPSANPNYRETVFMGGQTAPTYPADAISFDITTELPDNNIEGFDLGNFESNGGGGAIVRMYGDLKRHDMGPGLAENIDETGHGPSVWMTKELWGVGSTGQFLHDGRATTIKEAILEHGGEAAASKANFDALSFSDEVDLVRFLENLVLFFPEGEE